MENYQFDLLLETGALALLALWIATRTLPLGLSLALVTIRFALPVVYFAWYFDGAWTMLDDLTYLDLGARLLDLGHHPLSLLFDAQAYDTTCGLIGGRHILYVWWNLVAQYCFGEHYFAPVLMNVLLTFIAAEYAGRLAACCGAARNYCLVMQVFFLLHWDIVAWSTVMNLKDVLVLTLTIGVMYHGICWLQSRRLRSAIPAALFASLFYWLRFYIPLAMLAAAGIWVVGLWQDVRKYLLLPLIVAGAYIGNAQFLEYSEHFSSDGVLTNLIRFLLTPVPWSISEGWEFITVPSILHWVLFLPAVIGGLMLWRESLYARLPLVYFLVASVLYALTDDLLGPRHRLQVAFIILWSQFHLFWRLRHEELPNAQAAARARDTNRHGFSRASLVGTA